MFGCVNARGIDESNFVRVQLLGRVRHVYVRGRCYVVILFIYNDQTVNETFLKLCFFWFFLSGWRESCNSDLPLDGSGSGDDGGRSQSYSSIQVAVPMPPQAIGHQASTNPATPTCPVHCTWMMARNVFSEVHCITLFESSSFLVFLHLTRLTCQPNNRVDYLFYVVQKQHLMYPRRSTYYLNTKTYDG